MIVAPHFFLALTQIYAILVRFQYFFLFPGRGVFPAALIVLDFRLASVLSRLPLLGLGLGSEVPPLRVFRVAPRFAPLPSKRDQHSNGRRGIS